MITRVILRVPNFPTYFSTCFGNEGSIIDPLTRAMWVMSDSWEASMNSISAQMHLGQKGGKFM
jgi:hypothetical protein